MIRPADFLRRRVCPVVMVLVSLSVTGWQHAGAAWAPLPPATAPSTDPLTGPHALDQQLRTHPSPPSGAPARSPRTTIAAGGPTSRSVATTAGSSGVAALASIAPGATATGAPAQKEVLGFAPYWTLSHWSQWRLWLLSTVAYFGITLDGNGNIVNDDGMTGWNSADLTNLVQMAHAAGDRVLVTVKCFDEASIAGMVSNGAAIDNAVNNAILLARQRGLDGVNVDFEGYGSSQYPNLRGQFTTFMGTMTARVHAAVPNSEVVVDTYASSATSAQGMFDIGALAPNVDAMYVMAYDMNPTGITAATAPLGGQAVNDTAVVQAYVSQAGASKVILGVPYYGYKWSVASPGETAATTPSTRSAVTYADSIGDLACAQKPSVTWNASAATHWASWYSPSLGDPCGSNLATWREMYFDDPASLSAKYDLVNQSGIRGTGPWALGYDAGRDELWNTIQAKLNVGHNLSGGTAAPVVAANSTPAGPVAAGVEGTDAGLWVTLGGSSGFSPQGGRLVAAPALAWVPAGAGAGSLLAVVTGTDHQLWERIGGSAWTPLSSSFAWCTDAPAITVTGSPGALTLSVGCWGSDNGLWVAQTPVTPTALPRIGSFTSYGGTLLAGPTVSWVAGVVTYVVTGSGGTVWTRSSITPWTITPWTCLGHPAAAASGQVAYFACQGNNKQLWSAVNGGGGWNSATPVGGSLLGGPGLAARAGGGVVAFVEGVDAAMYERLLDAGGPQGMGFTRDGGAVRGGGGAGAA